MAGLKVTLDAALRARDVSRPTPADEETAERALPEQLAMRRRPGGAPDAQGAAADSRPPRPGGRVPQPDPGRPPKPGPPGQGKDDRGQDHGGTGGDGGKRPEQQDNAQTRQPRTRRRQRLGRLADHGSGGSSPDFS
jgi:hypothetical protein